MSDAEFTAPETSLADDLSSAIDAAVAVADDAAPAKLPPVEAQDAPEAAPAEGASKERDAHGRFVKGDPDKPAPVAEQQTKPAEAAPAEVKADVKPEDPVAQNLNAPPSTWTAKAKAEWATLPESIRAEVKKREADVAKGFEQYSQKARLADEMAKEIAPYQQLIDRQGGTPTTVIRSLLATAAQLHSGTPQDRGRLVMQIAQQYGADITPYIGGAQQPAGDASGINPQQLQAYVQQLVTPYEQRLQQYEQQVLTAQQQREQEQQQQLQAVIAAFQAETLPDGSPKHTYFDNVRTVMSGLLNSGAAQSLEQAYEMACRADPEVSAAIQSEQARKAQATQLEEARRKAEEAKRAQAANVRGQGGVGMADTSKLTLRDELLSHFDRSAA